MTLVVNATVLLAIAALASTRSDGGGGASGRVGLG
jgi:hypothetical protein